MLKILKQDAYVIDAEKAKSLRLFDDPILPSTDWIGEWEVGEPKFVLRNPEDESQGYRATVELKAGEKTVTIPLQAIAGSRVVEPNSTTTAAPYVPGHKVYLRSQAQDMLGKSVTYKSRLEDPNTVVIPKKIKVNSMILSESEPGRPAVNGRFIDGYYAWALAKVAAGKQWPNLSAYAAELSKVENRDPDLTVNHRVLTPVVGVNALQPELKHCTAALILE